MENRNPAAALCRHALKVYEDRGHDMDPQEVVELFTGSLDTVQRMLGGTVHAEQPVPDRDGFLIVCRCGSLDVKVEPEEDEDGNGDLVTYGAVLVCGTCSARYAGLLDPV